MARMEWDNSLSVGVPEIDDQHKELIRRLNAVEDAVVAHEGEREVARTLDFLTEYVDFHFAAEEKLMAERSYPGLESHRVRHAALKETLADLVRDFDEEGATINIAQSIRTFLVNWLTRHIRSVDREFSSYLLQNSPA